MSTITVVRKDGRAAIAADTLTKYGCGHESSEYFANSSKIVRVDDTYIGAVGHASTPLALHSFFAGLKKVPPMSTQLEIFELTLEMHGVLKEHYFFRPKEDVNGPFESIQSQMLFCNRYGIFGVYALGSVAEYTKFYAFGSGGDHALGAMSVLYDTDATAASIARAGVAAAAQFDDSTGLPIEVISVELRPD